jgi:hypothetical protein
VAGELITSVRLERARLRSKWPKAWKRASARKLRRWLRKGPEITNVISGGTNSDARMKGKQLRVLRAHHGAGLVAVGVQSGGHGG